MDKDKNKGLADKQEGEFILNESGTSVTIDAGGEFSEDKAIAESEAQVDEGVAEESGKTESK
jgi:hypothetical protein